MIKFASILLCSFLLSSSAFAGIINSDLTEDTYFSYGGYDWTWASSINITNYERIIFGQGLVKNTFVDASFHDGWIEIVNSAEHPTLKQLFSELTLSNFLDSNDNPIHSAAYWNSTFHTVDKSQFERRKGMKNPDDSVSDFYYETFYVRVTPPAQPITVPEPTTLLIFGATLIGFSLRQRMSK